MKRSGWKPTLPSGCWAGTRASSSRPNGPSAAVGGAALLR